MGNKSYVRVTKIILNITLVIFFMVLIGGILSTLFNTEIVQNEKIVSVIVKLLSGYIIFSILILLRKIISSVSNKNPFCKENINRFKKIGYYIIAMGVLYGITDFFNGQNDSGLITTPYGSIGSEIFIFILLGCLALLLSEIFYEAMEIKNENDMTI